MIDDPKENDPSVAQAPSANEQPAHKHPDGPPREGATKAVPQEAPKPPLGKRILHWFLALIFILLALAFAYRWAGTSTYRGTVQRVYEDQARYKIEFVSAEGDVLVLENETMSFPHFKADSADLQAELHRYSETGDIVDLTAWGFRAAWFSVFPNAVAVDFVRSNKVRQKKHVDLTTDAVVNELIDQGVVERGPESERMRPGLRQVLEKAMNPPPLDAEESPPEGSSESEE